LLQKFLKKKKKIKEKEKLAGHGLIY